MTSTTTKRALEHAERQCADSGRRLTEKRRQVLAGLLESDKALSAYELADVCREKLGADLLPMSVYRILAFLEDADLVHRLNLANKYVACSHIACDHAHESPQFLICKSCHHVSEVAFPRTTINSIAKTIDAAGYQLASDQLEVDCLCHSCAGAGA